MMRLGVWVRVALAGGLLMHAVACVRMGPATPQLSMELGDRIAEMRGLHELTLRRFFDAERQRIEDFVDREWTPLFLRNFLGTSGLLNDIAQAGVLSATDQAAIQTAAIRYLDDSSEAPALTRAVLEAVARTRSSEPAAVRTVLQRFVQDARLDAAATHISSLLRSEDPAILVLEWAEDAQEQINLTRRQMLEPVNEAERLTTSEVATAYSDMAQANGVITGRLEAAARLTQQQDALLRSFGVDSIADKMRERLGAISQAIGSALSTARSELQNRKSDSEITTILRDGLRTRIDQAIRN